MAGRIQVAPRDERTADGIVFDSRREMGEYLKLKSLERAGIIRNLKVHVAFPLVVNGLLITKYEADFTCEDQKGKLEVYDAKGHQTQLYKLKAKLFHALYPHLRIVEL